MRGAIQRERQLIASRHFDMFSWNGDETVPRIGVENWYANNGWLWKLVDDTGARIPCVNVDRAVGHQFDGGDTARLAAEFFSGTTR